MDDSRYSLLSRMGKDFVKREKKELGNFNLIKEITLEQARKLGGYSEGLITNLGIYTNEKSTSEEKVKALEAVRSNYTKLVEFARKYRGCFEVRKVFLMCEAKMISARINPIKLNEDIKRAEANGANGENNEA